MERGAPRPAFRARTSCPPGPVLCRWARCPGSLSAWVPSSPGCESLQVAGTPTTGGWGRKQGSWLLWLCRPGCWCVLSFPRLSPFHLPAFPIKGLRTLSSGVRGGEPVPTRVPLLAPRAALSTLFLCLSFWFFLSVFPAVCFRFHVSLFLLLWDVPKGYLFQISWYTAAQRAGIAKLPQQGNHQEWSQTQI